MPRARTLQNPAQTKPVRCKHSVPCHSLVPPGRPFMTILCSCVLSIVQDTRIPGTERGGKKGGAPQAGGRRLKPPSPLNREARECIGECTRRRMRRPLRAASRRRAGG